MLPARVSATTRSAPPVAPGTNATARKLPMALPFELSSVVPAGPKSTSYTALGGEEFAAVTRNDCARSSSVASNAPTTRADRKRIRFFLLMVRHPKDFVLLRRSLRSAAAQASTLARRALACCRGSLCRPVLPLVKRLQVLLRKGAKGRRCERILAQDGVAVIEQLLRLGVVAQARERASCCALGDRGSPVVRGERVGEDADCGAGRFKRIGVPVRCDLAYGEVLQD